MKQNERTSMDTFNPGEYCRFSNEEIPRILDILRANGHDVIDNEYPYGEDCVFCFPTGGMSHFARSLMTDGFVNYTELPRHEFMVKALRIGWRLGARMIDIPQQQRQHIIDELITLEVELTNDIEKTLSDIPYLEWCRRLCVEPIVEPKQGLPENGWAILCTEESMAHPMWMTMIKSIGDTYAPSRSFNGWCLNSLYGINEINFGDCSNGTASFGPEMRLITIDDWCRMTGNVKSEPEINTSAPVSPIYNPTPEGHFMQDHSKKECRFLHNHRSSGHVGGQIPDELKHDDFYVELDSDASEPDNLSLSIYPLTIVADRYNGAYSGALFLAFELDARNIPIEIGQGDPIEMDFWHGTGRHTEYKIGKGRTIDEAVKDLFVLLNPELGPEFNASMLEIGEWMETDMGADGQRNLICRLPDRFVDIRNPHGTGFYSDVAEQIKGRKVSVKLEILEP